MKASRAVVTVVIDATVVINLVQARCLDILGNLEGYSFVVPGQVVEEVSYPDEATVLARALEEGNLRKETSTDPGEIERYAAYRGRMGKGEAACLAMSATRNWVLASDDRGRAFLRMVRQHIGVARLIDTATILRAANDLGLLSPDQLARIRRFLDG